MDRKHVVFLKVAELGNITAAANALHIAQPSLTRTISSLEEAFGTKLFLRQPRGMKLTEEGLVLYRHLKEMEAVYNRACRDVESVKRGFHDAVRIGCGLTYQLLLMPEILRRLWRDFPQSSFQIQTGSAEDHARALRDGELDFVITAAIEKVEDPLIEVTRLCRIEHGVAHWPGVLPDIPDTEKMPMQALEDLSWVLFQIEPQLKSSMENRFYELELAPPRIALTTSSLQLGLELLRTNGMVMSVPTLLRHWLRERGYRLHATSEPIWQLDSGIATLKANHDHPIAEALKSHAKELVQSLPVFAAPET
ncbi:LysR substrate-binding domain-containing protein [Primorskyibacter sp. 2E233]|uniref:LysR substrate-binding domain-containing protein n=1 Tax=Primorskyibacter sp. 2E233 TaxID=3413431 RepID=UPI003BF2C5E8